MITGTKLTTCECLAFFDAKTPLLHGLGTQDLTACVVTNADCPGMYIR